MKHTYSVFSRLVKLLLVLLIATLIMACGGGEQSNSSASVATVQEEPASTVETIPETTSEDIDQESDYAPDPEQLTEVAETSQDLFVDESFSFDSHAEVTFDISATDINGLPLSHLILAISIIDKDIVEYDDPRLQQKSLISIAKTDMNGQIYITLELPQTATKLLLELNVVGMQNEVIVTINDDGYVIHHFTQQS